MNGRVFRSIPPNLPSSLAPTFNSQPKLKFAIKQDLNSWIQIISILAWPSTSSVGTSHLSMPSLILARRQKFYFRPLIPTLSRLVLTSIPTYWMSSFQLLKNTCAQIDARLRDFFWGFSDSKHHLYPKAWDSICKPQSSSGLGFRRAHDLNKALVSNLGWTIDSNADKLWANLLRSKYLRGHSLLNALAKTNSPPLWHGIILSPFSNWATATLLAQGILSTFGMIHGYLLSKVSFPHILQPHPTSSWLLSLSSQVPGNGTMTYSMLFLTSKLPSPSNKSISLPSPLKILQFGQRIQAVNSRLNRFT